MSANGIETVGIEATELSAGNDGDGKRMTDHLVAVGSAICSMIEVAVVVEEVAGTGIAVALVEVENERRAPAHRQRKRSLPQI